MCGVLDGFVADNEETSLEIVDPILIKAAKPFLRIWKKIGRSEHQGGEAD